MALPASRAADIVEHLLTGLPGLSFGTVVELLRRHGRDIDATYLPRAATLVMLSAVVSLAKRFEPGVPVLAGDALAPVFILGHWRSGTTLLHRLLACDQRFSVPNLYQTSLPHCFLSTERWLRGPAQRLLPATRGYDDLPLDLSGAWEDETAVFTMTLLSSMMNAVFPRRGADFVKYMAMEQVEPAEREAWSRALVLFISKTLAARPGRPLLKSPPHTARMRGLRALYPRAKFIHVHRHPYRVFSSTVHMMSVFGARVQLQRPASDSIENNTISYYRAMHDAYFAARGDFGSDVLVEIRYEDLVRDPVAHLANAYAQLSLGDFGPVGEAVRAQLSDMPPHRSNTLPPPTASWKARIDASWSASFSNWGYDQ